MAVARFVALHAVPENHQAGVPRFAVVIGRAAGGVVLVFNRFRQVWELPGGLIDPGDTPRTCAIRELREEAGCEAGSLEWLGLVEVSDGRHHLGAVFECRVAGVPEAFESDETSAITLWTAREPPTPMGDSDAALLARFGGTLAE